MTAAAPTGESRRGPRHWWRWPAVILVGLPALVFAAANLWLASPWGRGWIGSKIAAASHFETTVAGASWSPWGGARLRGVRIAQPPALADIVAEPLAEIDSIRVFPAWRALLRGRLSVREVDVDSPKIVLPLQILAYLVEQTAPPPAVAAAKPDPEIPPIAGLATPGQPDIAPPAPAPFPPTAAHPPDPSPDPAPTPIPQDAPAVVAPSPEANGWVNISKGSFKLVFAGLETALIELELTDAAIPVSGGSAESRILLGRLAILGQVAMDGLELPLRRHDRILSVGPVVTESLGIQMRLGAKLAFSPGLPLEFEALLPEQNPAEPIELGGHAVHPAALVAALRFHGRLLSPSSWQGEAIASANDIAVTKRPPPPGEATQQADFSRGGAVVVMAGGAISCLDARLIGDELSFLGNGARLADGRAAAVLRVVASPAGVSHLCRRFFPALEGPPALTSLATPQRAAFDMEILGLPDGVLLRLGQDGPLIELREAIAAYAPSP